MTVRLSIPLGLQLALIAPALLAGDIGPAPFAVSGRRFLLELKRSDRLGPLKADELAVTRAEGAS